MSAKLYVVGTPIGNLGDLSPRAAEALEKCDFIAAEDTRVTLKLFNHFGYLGNFFFVKVDYRIALLIKPLNGHFAHL